MKYLFSIVLLFATITTSQSQVLISLILGDKLNSGKLEFGLTGGLNFSGISKFESNRVLGSFNLGFYFDIKLKDESPWVFNTGVLVKSNVGNGDLSTNDLLFLDIDTLVNNESGTYVQQINYFYVPLIMKYYVSDHIYFEAGGQVGLRGKAFVQFEDEIEDVETLIKYDNRDEINSFDLGITAGFGYRIFNKNGMNIGTRFYQGLTSVYKKENGYLNSSLYFYINIPIGKGKAAAKAAEKEALEGSSGFN